MGDTVVLHRDADRPPVSDQDAQTTGSRDGSVDQIALQHHIVCSDH
ncbi:unnamed protein product, partial [marine sediment metagenome]